MNTKQLALASVVIFSSYAFTACNSGTGEENMEDSTAMEMETTESMSYIDLNTGQPVEVKWDDDNTNAMNAVTNDPLAFYVDMNTLDTFYGRTGTIVNNAILRTEEGKYELDENKVKWDGGDLKIKYADGSKLKVDEDGDRKFKSGDGDLKIKQKDGEVKVKKDGEVVHKTEGYNK